MKFTFGELDSEGSPGYWSLQARFFDAGGVEVGVQESISVTNPGHSWTRINGILTKPISATTGLFVCVPQSVRKLAEFREFLNTLWDTRRAWNSSAKRPAAG